MTIKYLNKNFEIESINIDFVNDAITTYSIELPTKHFVVELTTDENYCWCVLRDVAAGVIGYYPLPIDGWEDRVYEFELWLHNQLTYQFADASIKWNFDILYGIKYNHIKDGYLCNESMNNTYQVKKEGDYLCLYSSETKLGDDKNVLECNVQAHFEYLIKSFENEFAPFED